MADNALMRHRRMQETQRAFAEQFNRETPQDYPVVERGNTGTFTSSMLPIATYANGRPSSLPGTLLSEAADQAPRVANPIDDILSMYGLTAASNALMRR